MLECQFCFKHVKNKISKGLHERWCDKNPNKITHHSIGQKSWNSGLSKNTDIRVKKNAEHISKSYINREPMGCCGKEYLGTEKHKQSSSRGGGYRENAGRSKKFKVLDSFNKMICLQSTYELKCSNILNELNIKWVRPKALKYDNRNYFGDFYLVDYDVYLDTKNSYKAKIDEEKIQKVKLQNNIKLFVLLEHHITKEYINDLIFNPWVAEKEGNGLISRGES